MARTRVGFNVGRSIDNWEFIYNYMERANPVSMLFMDHFGEALTGYERQKKANPLTEPVVSYRGSSTIGQDNTYQKMLPTEVLNSARQIWGQGNRHIWVILDNEPHANGEDEIRYMAKFFATCIKLLCNDGFKVIVGNFSAGTIDYPEFMHEFLETVAEYKDQVLLSEHMYAMINPNFGWQHRRNPETNAIVQMPVEVALDYMEPKYWLSRKQIQTIFDAPFAEYETWHYGRIKKFYEYARTQGWELPKFVATEGLMDGLPDLESFNNKPRTFYWRGNVDTVKGHIQRNYGTNPYSEIKGEMTYQQFYTDAYGMNFEGVWYMMLSWVDRSFPKECLGINCFTLSNAEDWTRYGHNYLTKPDILYNLEELASTRPYNWVGGQDMAAPDNWYLFYSDVYLEGDDSVFDIKVDKNDERWARYSVDVKGNLGLNVRQYPNDLVIGSLQDGMVVEWIDTTEFDYNDGVHLWKPIIYGGGVAWIASDLVSFTRVDPVDTGKYVSLEDFEAHMQALTDQFTDLEMRVDDLDVTTDNVIISKAALVGITATLMDVAANLGNIVKIFQEVEDSVTFN